MTGDTYKQLFENLYALAMEVKQENTDEFMEYYEQRMHEFEQRAKGIGS